MGRKFKRVILHFGGDKTGSTAIQSALDGSRQELMESGLVAYPPGRWHAQLGSVFCDFPEQYIFNSLRGVVDTEYLREHDRQYVDELKQWIKAAPKCEVLVFSYEGFVNLDENALRRFREFCEAFAEMVWVVLYVRPPLSYAVSVMSQRVKQGRHSWPANAPPIAPYKTFLEKITPAFGKENVLVRLFSPEALKQNDVVADFMSILGVSEDIVERMLACNVRSNDSLSRPALCLGESMISILAERGVCLSDGEFHVKYGQHLSSIPGERIRLTAEQIKEIIAASRPHTEYLNRQFGIIFGKESNNYLRASGEKLSGQDTLMQSVGQALADIVLHNRQTGLVEHAAGTLDSVAVLGAIAVGEAFDLPVRLGNASAQSWVSTVLNPINLAYHWLDQSGQLLVFDGARTPLSARKILPGQTLAALMRVVAPSAPGRYRLLLVPVQGVNGWFDEKGFTPGQMELAVVAADTARHYSGADIGLFSQVGQRDDSALESTGQKGFLLFGPYVQLPAGRYIARLSGQCESGGPGVWVDVARNTGEHVITRLELPEGVSLGQIAELPFELTDPASDLEVRMWVTAEARVRIEALDIEPVETEAAPPVPAKADDVASALLQPKKEDLHSGGEKSRKKDKRKR